MTVAGCFNGEAGLQNSYMCLAVCFSKAACVLGPL